MFRFQKLLQRSGSFMQPVRTKITAEHLLSQKGNPCGVERSQYQIALDTKSHMNFMPIPEGCWYYNYDKRNQKFNLMLGAAAIFFCGTLYVMDKTHCFFFNDLKAGKVCIYPASVGRLECPPGGSGGSAPAEPPPPPPPAAEA